MGQLNVTRKECVSEADFIDDLGADSLDILELVMAKEDNFDIEISDDELEKIRTIRDVLAFIQATVVKAMPEEAVWENPPKRHVQYR